MSETLTLLEQNPTVLLNNWRVQNEVRKPLTESAKFCMERVAREQILAVALRLDSKLAKVSYSSTVASALKNVLGYKFTTEAEARAQHAVEYEDAVAHLTAARERLKEEHAVFKKANKINKSRQLQRSNTDSQAELESIAAKEKEMKSQADEAAAGELNFLTNLFNMFEPEIYEMKFENMCSPFQYVNIVDVISLCFVCGFTAETKAIALFNKKYDCRTESSFVSSSYPITNVVNCEDSVYKALLELHKECSNGSASFGAAKRRKGQVEAEVTGDTKGAQIPTTFTAILLPAKKMVERWNFESRVCVVKHLIANKGELGSVFKSWAGVLTFVVKRQAREIVWSTVMSSFGYFIMDPATGELPRDEILENGPFTPRTDYVEAFPKTSFEIPYIDWAMITKNIDDFGGNDYVDEKLVPYLIAGTGGNYKLKLTKQGANSPPDVSDLIAPSNMLYRNFYEALKAHLFVPLRPKVAKGGAAAAAAAAAGENFFKPDDLGMVGYSRFFPNVHSVPVKAVEGEQEQDCLMKLERDMESMRAGPSVKVVLLHESSLKLSSVFSTHFGTKEGDYRKRLTLGFADPPWGVSNDKDACGGIDQKEERWGTCVFVSLLYILNSR